MNLLAIETSGFSGSVAVVSDHSEPVERTLSTSGRRHAQTLVSEIDQLLRHRSLVPQQIDVVAVSVGPGSFTGLRVGVVCAKTFAWANDCQLVAVDTLQAIAQRVPDRSVTARVIMDAQRQECFVNDFSWSDTAGLWTSGQQVKIVPAAELAVASKDVLLTGPGVARFQDAWKSDQSLAEEALRHPDAATVAIVGRKLATHEQFASITQLEPVYIRRSYAEEKAAAAVERRQS